MKLTYAYVFVDLGPSTWR